MSREEFREWVEKLTASKRAAVSYVIANYIFGEEHSDELTAAQIRKLVYENFPEWH